MSSIRPAIDEAVQRTIDSGSFIQGEAVAAFERMFADYIGVGHCIGCGNGTDALELALEALGIGPGDEVIVPAHTWISSASCVSKMGAQPVFADCSDTYYTLDVEDVSRRITARTRAVIAVHLYGQPADVAALRKLLDTKGIFLIEDAAQAHGAAFDGRKVGSFGHLGTFSFYPSKNLGAFGDGGAVVTKDEAIAKRIRAIQNCGQVSKNAHAVPGRNSRLDTLQAAVLQVKLPLLDSWNESRRQAAALYDELLDKLPVRTPAVMPSAHHVYHIYAIQINEKQALKSFLTQSGIGVGEHYPKALPDLDFYRSKDKYKAQEYVPQLLSLPMFPGITDEEIHAVVASISDFYNDSRSKG